MILRRRRAPRVLGLAVIALAVILPPRVHAGDLYLADGGAFPGKLWSTTDRVGELIHARAGQADPAFPAAAMKLGHVAVTHAGEIYYASGLDGYVMHLLDGKHEIAVFEFPGQIRDVACTAEPHTVYFSVVPTPKDNEPLADGEIYRRDLWEGQPTLVATVRQADVGGAWWGNFTVRNDAVYLSTFEKRSRLYRLADGQPVPVFPANQLEIRGLATTGPEFLVADGSSRIYRTPDFRSFVLVYEGDGQFTDVAPGPPPTIDAPGLPPIPKPAASWQ